MLHVLTSPSLPTFLEWWAICFQYAVGSLTKWLQFLGFPIFYFSFPQKRIWQSSENPIHRGQTALLHTQGGKKQNIQDTKTNKQPAPSTHHFGEMTFRWSSWNSCLSFLFPTEKALCYSFLELSWSKAALAQKFSRTLLLGCCLVGPETQLGRAGAWKRASHSAAKGSTWVHKTRWNCLALLRLMLWKQHHVVYRQCVDN